MCKPCQEKWRIVLAQQSKITDMKDSKKIVRVNDVKVNNEEIVKDNLSSLAVSGKLDFNKLVEDRRKVLLEGKTINK